MYESGWTEDEGAEDWRVPDSGSEELNEILAEKEFEREVEARGVQSIAVDFLVASMGKPEAIAALIAVGPCVRGDPALAVFLDRLRALRREGMLTDAGYFYLVSTYMRSLEFIAADGDPEAFAMLEWLHANRKPDPAAMPGHEDDNQSEEWREVDAEHTWRCHLASMQWLRELGEYEMAFLAENDLGMHERKRIAGEGDVCGRTWISSNRCPENDGVRGYRDPLC